MLDHDHAKSFNVPGEGEGFAIPSEDEARAEGDAIVISTGGLDVSDCGCIAEVERLTWTADV
ncbi:hypothetical protein P691DRAFT_811516, partial [Macrolepiota fuliginosa MF-IS2]